MHFFFFYLSQVTRKVQLSKHETEVERTSAPGNKQTHRSDVYLSMTDEKNQEGRQGGLDHRVKWFCTVKRKKEEKTTTTKEQREGRKGARGRRLSSSQL